MIRGFVSWSGGKDCCLAAYQANLQGIEIVYLLNMVTADKTAFLQSWDKCPMDLSASGSIGYSVTPIPHHG